MKYHFKLHKENIGYWAECCELEGCVTQVDTLEEVYAACKEALEVYLYDPDNSERIVPLPDKTLDGRENIIQVTLLTDSKPIPQEVEERIAVAFPRCRN
ncbi:MAG: type II toxin-antitoxin system HicB family antitoxin [Spirochaetaceae bacterium]|jgi:predicted RNase H-like HicB family nuclease|nr:type II toxin-antitoxin system HicB family antitoxin [Spirochaetaceae bacterium]